MRFTAQKDDRVKKINEQISSKIKVPAENQMLLLGSKALDPEKKLSHYWFDPSTTMHLTLKVVKPSDEELEAFLMEADEGKKHPFSIRRSSSVAQVKEIIKGITSGLLKDQTVYCNGKRLEDGKTMSDYLILNINIFFLCKKCIGG
ncbi:ubiquitin D isoform X2 [Phascolarctos cinereus]|nr:ubiquitin D isoform X2 [Phascolarctos cinereus]